jgi:hypothetical protein
MGPVSFLISRCSQRPGRLETQLIRNQQVVGSSLQRPTNVTVGIGTDTEFYLRADGPYEPA